MGRAIPITIGGEIFPRKEDATLRVRELISKYEVGSYLSSADEEFCKDLFNSHPECVEKIGSGISRIEVRLDIYGHKHFQIHRSDQTNIDISWPHCIRHRKS